MSSFPFRTLLAALLASSCFVPAVQAATITWDGGAGTTNWFDAANWYNDTIPTGTNGALIQSGFTAVIDGMDTETYFLNVGYASSSEGHLTIRNGASLTTTDTLSNVYVGHDSLSQGSITVTGTNSSLSSARNIIIGSLGTGTLTVSDGGYASTATGYYAVSGDLLGGTGTIIVTGSGAKLESGGEVRIGNFGTGSLVVADGGSVSSASGYNIYAGTNTGSTGTITVTGSGSTLESGGQIHIGNSGQATLTVENGGSVTSASGYSLYAGTTTGSMGTITVTGTGSTLESGKDVRIGCAGTGSLTVSDGGVVASASGDSLYAGVSTGGTGTITVTGLGSKIESDGAVFIGYSGDGLLTVSNGGLVETTSSNSNILAGHLIGSTGTITVTGFNSTLASDRAVVIGNNGVGILTVSDGGLVTSATGYNIEVGQGTTGTGTVIVTGAGSTLESGLAIRVGSFGTGTLTVSDSGAVTASTVSIANQSGSTGTLNIGAASGSSAVAPGTVTASGGIVFGSGTGTIVFNHTSTAYTFANSISGSGTIESLAGTTYLTGDLSGFTGTFDLAGGTLSVVTSGVQTLSNSLTGSGTMAFASGTTYLTGDSSSFTGTANVSGSGILSVNGTLGGTVDVASGGTLKGSGTVGGIDAASGGRVAPGNSIGTLSVSGNVSFASGSTYDVEANLTSSDKIEATGAASITGGDVSLIPYQGALLRAGTTYTILSAAGGVSGAFDRISFADPLLFLTATLSYDATDVYASVIRNGVSLASVAGSGNQANAAAAIESLGAGNAVYDAVAMQSDVGTTRQAYQALSGEIHANVKATLLEDQAAFGRVLAGRLAQAEDNQTGFAAPVTAKAPVVASARERILYGDKIANDAAVANAKIAPTVWAQGFGGWGSRDGDANARDFKHQDKGLMLGVDGMMGDNWRLGLAFGYDHADYNQEDETGDKGTSERYSVSAYGGRSWGKLSLRSGLTYAYSDIDTKRGVSFPYYSDYLKGSYNAHSVSGFAEAAYGFGDKESKIEPFANLAWGYVKVPGFTEKGGAAALTAKDSDGTLGSTTLGARVRQVLPFLTSANNRAAFQASAGWMHAIGDANPETSLRFAGSSAFKTQAAPLARDAAVLGAGIDYLIGQQTTLGLAYTGQIGAHADTQALRGNLSYRF